MPLRHQGRPREQAWQGQHPATGEHQELLCSASLLVSILIEMFVLAVQVREMVSVCIDGLVDGSFLHSLSCCFSSDEGTSRNTRVHMFGDISHTVPPDEPCCCQLLHQSYHLPVRIVVPMAWLRILPPSPVSSRSLPLPTAAEAHVDPHPANGLWVCLFFSGCGDATGRLFTCEAGKMTVVCCQRAVAVLSYAELQWS